MGRRSPDDDLDGLPSHGVEGIPEGQAIAMPTSPIAIKVYAETPRLRLRQQLQDTAALARLGLRQPTTIG